MTTNRLRYLLLIIFITLFFLSFIVKNDSFANILNSFSINVLSTLLLFYILDKREIEKKESEEQKRENILLENYLIPTIKDFYIVIVFMYSASIGKKFTKEEIPNLVNNYNDIYQSIIKLDLTQDSCVLNYSFDNKFNINFINWLDLYIINTTRYIEKLKEIKNVNYYNLDYELIKYIDKIIKSDIYINKFDKLKPEIYNKYNKYTINKPLLESLKLYEILESSYKLMQYINNKKDVCWIKDFFFAEDFGGISLFDMYIC